MPSRSTFELGTRRRRRRMGMLQYQGRSSYPHFSSGSRCGRADAMSKSAHKEACEAISQDYSLTRTAQVSAAGSKMRQHAEK